MSLPQPRAWAAAFGGALLVCLLAGQTAACSIPVFRYALERWPADLFVATVDVGGEATAATKAAVHWLEDQARPNGGSLNLVVERQEVSGPAQDAGKPNPKPRVEPGVEIAWMRRGEPPVTIWSGACDDVQAALSADAWRDELIRRLATGDAVVWLVLEGNEAAAATRAAELLHAELPQLAEDTPLPRGIGLPGSELLAALPLEVRFSVLRVPADAVGEPLLRATLLAGSLEAGDGREALDPQASLIVPVFGRGRAAVVLPAATLTSDAVAEFTRFLCGACSCQVKQLNPGFDLLLPVDWEQVLFGEGLAALPPATEPASAPRKPELVPIPSGRSPSRGIRPRVSP
jgi:hypothetical protein